eukprot:2789920-Prymnesium_polylepis.1
MRIFATHGVHQRIFATHGVHQIWANKGLYCLMPMVPLQNHLPSCRLTNNSLRSGHIESTLGVCQTSARRLPDVWNTSGMRLARLTSVWQTSGRRLDHVWPGLNSRHWVPGGFTLGQIEEGQSP